MATQGIRIPVSNPAFDAGRSMQSRMANPKSIATASQPQGSSKSSTKKLGSQKRKRTKTGCQTCRKRRIKCDETQPICQNCMRSRRLCEGYKNPLLFRNSSVGPFAFSNGYNLALEDMHSFYQIRPPVIASSGNPGIQLPQQALMPFSGPRPYPVSEGPTFTSGGFVFPGHGFYPDHGPGSDAVRFNPLRPPFTSSFVSNHGDAFTEDLLRQRTLSINGQSSLFFPESALQTSCEEDAVLGSTISSLSPTARQSVFESDGLHDDTARLAQTEPGDFTFAAIATPVSQEDLVQWPILPALYDPEVTLGEDFVYCGSPEILAGDLLRIGSGDENLTPGIQGELLEGSLSKHDLAGGSEVHPNLSFVPLINTTQPPSIFDTEPVESPLELDSYHPPLHNPLDDPYTRNVFQHFITTSGALLTVFDRSSHVDLPITDQMGRPITYPGLFTDTLPMLALQNQGLLHAILALASLDIAKATGASTTPSLKHYSYSLRRVHGAVRTEKKRHAVTTLGSTLLLAFYEVATADHSKWNTHLSGASQLVREINFGPMTRQLRCMLMNQHTEDRRQSFDHYRYRDPLLNLFTDFDPNVFHMLTGKKLSFDHNGNIIRGGRIPDERTFSRAELMNYEVLRDLYWWYIRQDVIHALVGGVDLLLDYDDWTNCPPRAPIGQPMAYYGSMDYLWLLIGRLLRFICKDRKRKILAGKSAEQMKASSEKKAGSKHSPPQVQKSNESIIRPAGVQGPTPHSIPSRAPPPFYGMAPTLGTPPMPEVFQNPFTTHTKARVPSETLDLESATTEAWAEWQSIRTAFDAFAQALGPDYQPLPEDLHPSFDTPFGRAIHYRTNGIACVWGWYYTGLIVALRAHPSMPPYATVSVGAAASKTAQLANTIGRVVAGIHPDVSERPRRPSEAGAATDATVALFFAGVQYRDPEQRNWTIRWLRGAEALSGWDSIGLCANGCESAWVRAHEMGRGPAYTRVMGFEVEDVPTSPVIGERFDHEKDIAGPGGREERDGLPALEAKNPGEGGFLPMRRGEHVMCSYSLYTKATEEMAKMSLVGVGE